jgi:hypothetical protein
MSFRDTVQRISENVFHNSAFFAETVRYRDEQDAEYELTVTLRLLRSEKRDDAGTADTKEALSVAILKSDLDHPPTYGCRLYRAGDDRAYVWTPEGGKEQLARWKCQFVRTVKTGRSTK